MLSSNQLSEEDIVKIMPLVGEAGPSAGQLALEKNVITRIPADFNPGFNQIDLKNNRISVIEEAAMLKSLRKVKVWNTHGEYVESCILHLNGNQLQSLPRSLVDQLAKEGCYVNLSSNRFNAEYRDWLKQMLGSKLTI